MNTIKYIVSCIVGLIDAWAGRTVSGGIKETVVGSGVLLAVLLVYVISLSILFRKTNFHSTSNFLCALGITALFVSLAFALIILFENLFH